MRQNAKPKFEFQVSKMTHGDGGGFPEAVQSALEQFKAQAVHNMSRGAGTVLTAVANPQSGAYFAIVLAGPFSTLEALKAALVATMNEPLIEQMKRVGLE